MGSNWPMQFMAGLYGVKLPSGRDQESREQEAREQAAAAAREHSKAVVATWNQRAEQNLPPSFFPTFRTVLLAGTAIVECLCPGCRTIGEVDLRDYDFHADAPISALIPKLSCRRCCPNPPLARLIALKPHKTLGQDRWIPAPRRPI